MKLKDFFNKAANKVAYATGTATAFTLSLAVIVIWWLTGPAFGYSDTWQLVINTGTTIITFLMVFLIQNTQNRDSKAVQLKLDELIRSTKTARNDFMNLENLTDEEVKLLDEEFKEMLNKRPESATMKSLQSKIQATRKKREERPLSLNNIGNSLMNVVRKVEEKESFKK